MAYYEDADDVRFICFELRSERTGLSISGRTARYFLGQQQLLSVESEAASQGNTENREWNKIYAMKIPSSNE